MTIENCWKHEKRLCDDYNIAKRVEQALNIIHKNILPDLSFRKLRDIIMKKFKNEKYLCYNNNTIRGESMGILLLFLLATNIFNILNILKILLLYR